MELFSSVEAVREALIGCHYVVERRAATAVFLAGRLGKPLLVEGPAGVGKTELAKVLARATGTRFLRLQCYEGLDEARALYEWDYQKQLLRLQAASQEERAWERVRLELYSAEFLLERPLLTALRARETVTLLIDELDKADEEFESFLLEALSDFQVSIPELGTIQAASRPLVVITSNATRELSDAIKRRCLYLYLDFPSLEQEMEILRLKVPGIGEELGRQVVRFVQALRRQDLKKLPSIAETLDWARTLVLLATDRLDRQTVEETLPVLLKYQQDLVKVEKKLGALLS